METKFAKTMELVVSHTSRKSRPTEKDGVHYHFISKPTFEEGIQNNEFIEYANVHNNYYGSHSSFFDLFFFAIAMLRVCN